MTPDLGVGPQAMGAVKVPVMRNIEQLAAEPGSLHKAVDAIRQYAALLFRNAKTAPLTGGHQPGGMYAEPALAQLRRGELAKYKPVWPLPQEIADSPGADIIGRRAMMEMNEAPLSAGALQSIFEERGPEAAQRYLDRLNQTIQTPASLSEFKRVMNTFGGIYE